MCEEFKLLQPLQYLQQFLNQNIRPDGRKFDEFRDTSIKCDGSVMIKLGNTAVVCGVTSELMEAKAESPKCGVVSVTVELPPLCSDKYKPGVVNSDAAVITQLINNLITNSKLVNLEKLCVTEGKLVWSLNVEVICLNYDGNVIDASIMATIAALKNYCVQSVEVNDKNEISYLQVKNPIETSGFPVGSSFATFDGKILADPNAEEETLANNIINIVVNTNDNTIHLMSKTGDEKLDVKEFEYCYKLAIKRSKHIQRIIEQNFESHHETK